MLQRTAMVSSKERESQSADQVLFGKGGPGPWRGIDFGTAVILFTVEGLARMAIQQPLELLSLLPDIVAEVGLALWFHCPFRMRTLPSSNSTMISATPSPSTSATIASRMP